MNPLQQPRQPATLEELRESYREMSTESLTLYRGGEIQIIAQDAMTGAKRAILDRDRLYVSHAMFELLKGASEEGEESLLEFLNRLPILDITGHYRITKFRDHPLVDPFFTGVPSDGH